MKIAVCIKQVPNTEARLRVSRDGRWLDEEDLPFIITSGTIGEESAARRKMAPTTPDGNQ